MSQEKTAPDPGLALWTGLQLSRCKLIVLGGSQKGKELIVEGDVVLRIGKAEGNDLVLPEETVSRFHLEILRQGTDYLVRDLDSTNGTFVDGSRIREAYVRPGSIIRAGTVPIRFVPYEERVEILPSEKNRLGDLVGCSVR